MKRLVVVLALCAAARSATAAVCVGTPVKVCDPVTVGGQVSGTVGVTSMPPVTVAGQVSGTVGVTSMPPVTVAGQVSGTVGVTSMPPVTVAGQVSGTVGVTSMPPVTVAGQVSGTVGVTSIPPVSVNSFPQLSGTFTGGVQGVAAAGSAVTLPLVFAGQRADGSTQVTVVIFRTSDDLANTPVTSSNNTGWLGTVSRPALLLNKDAGAFARYGGQSGTVFAFGVAAFDVPVGLTDSLTRAAPWTFSTTGDGITAPFVRTSTMYTTVEIGLVPSTSSYIVNVSTSPVNLTPVALAGATHLTVQNLGAQSVYIGGADVASSGAHRGIQLASGASHTFDATFFGFVLYGIRGGALDQDIAVMRW